MTEPIEQSNQLATREPTTQIPGSIRHSAIVGRSR
jgi:hypothetical protein